MAREILITPEDISRAQERRFKKSKWSLADVPEEIRNQRDPYRKAGEQIFEVLQKRISSETT